MHAIKSPATSTDRVPSTQTYNQPGNSFNKTQACIGCFITYLLGVHMRMMPCAAPSAHVQVGHAVKVSGISCLVGVQRAVQNNGNMKSEPKIPGCEESPIRAFYC